MQEGDKIIYQYTHWLNSRSRTTIQKKGEFVRYVKGKPCNGMNTPTSMKCIVKLDGNKGNSTVWVANVKQA